MKKVVVDEDVDSDTFGGGGLYCLPFSYVHLLRNEKGIGGTQTQMGREREREYREDTRGSTVRLNRENHELAR